jgi:hypothetical protein
MWQEEIDIATYSSIGEALSLLARQMPRGRGERFLLELANLKQADPAAIARFQEKYSDFVIPPQSEQGELRLASMSPAARLGLYEVHDSFSRPMFNLQVLLRRAVDRPTALDRELALSLASLEVQKQFLRALERKRTDGPNPALDTPWKGFGNIFVALMPAGRLADRLRRCENPSCPAPYYIAKRRNQKFCTEICAVPAQQEQKRAWWNEKGEAWRRTRPKNRKGGKRRK